MAAKAALSDAPELWSSHPVYARYWQHYHQAMAWMRCHQNAYRKAVESYFSSLWYYLPEAHPHSSDASQGGSPQPFHDHQLPPLDAYTSPSHSREDQALCAEEEAESESDGVECDVSNMEITEELRQYFAETERHREERRCFECCIKCLGGVPYASLVATILCFSGVALFCGCGHVALAGTVAILEQHFSTNASDHALLSEVIQLMQYVIYGIASFFFLYGIILLAEGFYTTSAVKELHGEFKTTACGRCISGMFVFLTYVLGVAWLGVFGFSAVPVFMFHNIWATCEVIKSPQTNGTASVEQICVDVRQYGIIPWSAFPGRICGSALENICNTNEFYMSYHLFIVACAGAGATVIALLIYMMATTYNYAVLKFKSREDCCTKF
ncbi:neuronal membrane glycoprotein M6-b isoform X2 [Talpa occidentalis]|uniref:neuronal membrane glycoprotein M6-b isoform X2 n=1 Tax=Talpa occidentalis TaxID=50954 RepID=UPI0023F69616|nr:neuronal membrane glycoprotein M6-b isoform X2 [Talpa occidentalis]